MRANAYCGRCRIPRALEYEPASKGILPAREAVVGYYATRGITLTPSKGHSHGQHQRGVLVLLSPALRSGDEVLVPSPSYPLFEFLAEIQDVKLVPYELVYDHGWQIEFESLRQAITRRSRAIMVVHPNNPTGHFTRGWELERLNALCREHELALVVDEVFLDYGLTDEAADGVADGVANGYTNDAAEFPSSPCSVYPERTVEDLRPAAVQGGGIEVTGRWDCYARRSTVWK